MYCFFFLFAFFFLFFFCFFFTILSSDLRPPFGPRASWRLRVFCTLWWMLIGVFIIQSWMPFLLSVVLWHSFHFSYRHRHVSLKFKTKQNIPFRSFSIKKIPKAAPYTWRSPHPQHGDMTSCQKENDRKKRETHARTHSRDIADSFHKSSIGGGTGTVGDFSF